MRVWRYLTLLIALTATGVLAVTNLAAAAEGTDAGLWRWLMLLISVSADIGLVAFLMAALEHHRAGNIAAVFLSLAVWLSCGLYTGLSSTRWLEGQFHTMLDPIEANASRINAGLSSERAHLDAASQVALNATTQLKRDSAKADADATRKRITALEAQKWPATVVAAPTVKHVFIGYEWAFPLAALFISQVAWFVTFGSMGQPDSQPNHQQQPTTVGGPSGQVGLGQRLTAQQPLLNKPRLVVDNSNMDQPSTAGYQSGDLADRIQPLLLEGLSQMVIATRLGVKRWRVQQAVAAMKRSATVQL
jgi:hypothetical protein